MIAWLVASLLVTQPAPTSPEPGPDTDTRRSTRGYETQVRLQLFLNDGSRILMSMPGPRMELVDVQLTQMERLASERPAGWEAKLESMRTEVSEVLGGLDALAERAQAFKQELVGRALELWRVGVLPGLRGEPMHDPYALDCRDLFLNLATSDTLRELRALDLSPRLAELRTRLAAIRVPPRP
jgi:hypothetical protein